MRQMRAVTVMVALVFAAACSSGATGAGPAPAPTPEPPAVMDPVGVYTFEATFQGQTVTGRIVITGSPGAYGGSVEPDVGPPPVPITDVTVEGREITLTADAGGDELVIVMTFTGDTYTGTWVLGFDSGDLRGEKVEP